MNKRSSKYIPVYLLAMLLISCITTNKTNYLQPPGKGVPAYEHNAEISEYKLKAGDKLYIRIYSTHEETNQVFNNNNMSSMVSGDVTSSNSDIQYYVVQQDGTIHFPFAGDIRLAGNTVREAGRMLENSLSEYYKVNSVDVKLVGKFFSVIGSGKSGIYPMNKEKINIFQALALAGNVVEFGDRSKIKLLRETDSGTVVKVFDLRSRDIINSEFYYIEPYDVIYIQNLDEQFFSITNFPTLLATLISTISFGAVIYRLIIPAN